MIGSKEERCCGRREMIGCSEGGKEADRWFCPIAAEPAGKQANSNNYTDGSERTGSLTFQQGIRPAKAIESTIYISTHRILLCLHTQNHKTLNLLHPYSFIYSVQIDMWFSNT